MEKVLWIEDNALADLQELLGPIYMDGTYQLTLASDASEAINHLWQAEFVAVIVDIRIPPGRYDKWKKLYTDRVNNNTAARLGLEVLKTSLAHSSAIITIPNIPLWITPSKFAVFTVESGSDVEADVRSLGVREYKQKKVSTPPTILLDIIKRIKQQTR